MTKRIVVFMLVIVLTAMLAVPSVRAEDSGDTVISPDCCTPFTKTVVSNSTVEVIKTNTGLLTPYFAVAAFEPGLADPNPSDPNDSKWDKGLVLPAGFPGFTFSGADWIWESYRAVHPLEGDIVYFQKNFTIVGYPTAGTLYITCDNGYEAYLNGALVGSAQLSGAWETSNLTKGFVDTLPWRSVEAWNLSGHLNSGSNILIIKAVNEYQGPLDGQADGNLLYNPAGLIFQLDVSGNTCPPCTTLNGTVVSNSTVKVIKTNTGLLTPYFAVAAFEPGLADPNPSDPNDSKWDKGLVLPAGFPGFTFSGADWIWESYRAVHPLEGDIVYFQKNFTIVGYPTAGTLYITCDNGYEAYLNGALVGSAQLSGAWETSNLTKGFVDTLPWRSVEAWNLSGHLNSGSNILIIKAVNEYQGPLDGQADGNLLYNPAGLIFQLDVTYNTCPPGS